MIDWIEEFTFGEEIELEDVTEEKGSSLGNRATGGGGGGGRGAGTLPLC